MAGNLKFIDYKIEDIKKINKYFKYKRNLSCDYTNGMSAIWRDYYKTKYIEDNSNLCFLLDFYNWGKCFTVPIGENPEELMKNLYEFCKNENKELKFCVATAEDIEVIKKVFDIKQIDEVFMLNDYLYEFDDIYELKGRKHHRPKNHLNNFIKNHENYFSKIITGEDKALLLDFMDEYSNRVSKDSDSFREDVKKTKEVINNYEDYDMIGIIVYDNNTIDKKIVGFEIGDIVNDCIFCTIEKANKNINGSYQIVLHEFLKTYKNESILYVNREDASLDEGLMQSKESYKPLNMVEKSVVIIKDLLK